MCLTTCSFQQVPLDSESEEAVAHSLLLVCSDWALQFQGQEIKVDKEEKVNPGFSSANDLKVEYKMVQGKRMAAYETPP